MRWRAVLASRCSTRGWDCGELLDLGVVEL